MRKRNVIYILTNPDPSYRGLIYVGITSNLVRCLKRLSSSVPEPFECYYAGTVPNGPRVLRSIRQAFQSERHGESSSLFKVRAERIKALIMGHDPVRVIARSGDSDQQKNGDSGRFRLSAPSRKSTKRRKSPSRAGRFPLSEIDVPNRAQLCFLYDPSTTCYVCLAENRVEFEDERVSLSKAAELALDRKGMSWRTARGPALWLYKGESLADRLQRMKRRRKQR